MYNFRRYVKQNLALLRDLVVLLGIIFITQLNSAVCDLPTSNDARTTPFADCGGTTGNPADVVFLLDSSNSIWGRDFREKLAFVRDVTKLFPIDSGVIRVGLLSYAELPKIHFRLGEFKRKASVLDAISNVRQYGGYGTRTAEALRFMRKEGFLPISTNGVNATRIGIVITDGWSDDRVLTGIEAALARDQGIHLFAVGVGRNRNLRELHLISSHPIDFYTIVTDNNGGVNNIKDLLAIKTCAVTNLTKTITRQPSANTRPFGQTTTTSRTAMVQHKMNDTFLFKTLSQTLEPSIVGSSTQTTVTPTASNTAVRTLKATLSAVLVGRTDPTYEVSNERYSGREPVQELHLARTPMGSELTSENRFTSPSIRRQEATSLEYLRGTSEKDGETLAATWPEMRAIPSKETTMDSDEEESKVKFSWLSTSSSKDLWLENDLVVQQDEQLRTQDVQRFHDDQLRTDNNLANEILATDKPPNWTRNTLEIEKGSSTARKKDEALEIESLGQGEFVEYERLVNTSKTMSANNAVLEEENRRNNTGKMTAVEDGLTGESGSLENDPETETFSRDWKLLGNKSGKPDSPVERPAVWELNTNGSLTRSKETFDAGNKLPTSVGNGSEVTSDKDNVWSTETDGKKVLVGKVINGIKFIGQPLSRYFGRTTWLGFIILDIVPRRNFSTSVTANLSPPENVLHDQGVEEDQKFSNVDTNYGFWGSNKAGRRVWYRYARPGMFESVAEVTPLASTQETLSVADGVNHSQKNSSLDRDTLKGCRPQKPTDVVFVIDSKSKKKKVPTATLR